MERISITKLHVEGLWNKYSFDLLFDDDVNIFSGINGVGKSTVIDIIWGLLSGIITQTYTVKKIQSAVLFLSNNAYISVVHNEEGIEYKTVLNDTEISREELLQSLKLEGVATFDAYHNKSEYIKEISDVNQFLVSDLDMILNRWIARFHRYMTLIATFASAPKSAENKKTFSRLVTQLEVFKEKINLFLDDKIFSIDELGEIRFRLKNIEDTSLSVYDLSSGEKQLLILLISMLCMRKEPGICISDEPEISLHVSWQKQLISVLREMNPNMQLIITTHSPSILYGGWQNRVVNLQDVINHG